MTNTNSNSFTISATNIGGLSNLKTTISPGLNIVEEPNASGKTSFLRAISLLITPPGNHKELNHLLKFDAEKGEVVFSKNGQSIKKTVSKNHNTTLVEGDDIVPEELSTMVRNFTIGGSDNEILTAIRNGQNLKSLLTDDFNMARMKARIEEKEELVETIERELTQLKNVKTKLSGLVYNRDKAEKDLEELKEKRDTLKEDLQKFSKTAEQEDEVSQEYKDISLKVDQYNRNINQTKSLIESEKEEFAEIEKRLDKLNQSTPTQVEHTEADIKAITTKIKKLEGSLSPLRTRYENLISFVDGGQKILATFPELTNNNGSNTDILSSLSESDTTDITCPLCSHKATINVIKEQINHYKQEITDTKAELDSSTTKIKELEQEKKDIQQKIADFNKEIAQIKQAKIDLADIKSSINNRENGLKRLIEEKKELEDKKQELTGAIDSKYQKTSLQYNSIVQEIGQVEGTLNTLTKQIESGKEEIGKIPAKEDEFSKAKKELNKSKQELTDRKERLVNTFNETIKEVYSALNFDLNVYSIELTPQFDIEVKRYDKKGQPTTDSQSIKTLSKSELEVIGLVVMLSGYIINDLKNVFPYIVLDELTFMDDSRLKKLVEYMETSADSIILMKLPQQNEKMGDSFIKIEQAST